MIVANKDLESKNQALEQQADVITSKSTSFERQLKDANERILSLFLSLDRCYSLAKFPYFGDGRHDQPFGKRKGEVAERIIEKAKENDVPFYQDNKLAETLSKLQIGDTIPPELYDVVAEILVFVDDMDKMKAKLSRAGLL